MPRAFSPREDEIPQASSLKESVDENLIVKSGRKNAFASLAAAQSVRQLT